MDKPDDCMECDECWTDAGGYSELAGNYVKERCRLVKGGPLSETRAGKAVAKWRTNPPHYVKPPDWCPLRADQGD